MKRKSFAYVPWAGIRKLIPAPTQPKQNTKPVSRSIPADDAPEADPTIAMEVSVLKHRPPAGDTVLEPDPSPAGHACDPAGCTGPGPGACWRCELFPWPGGCGPRVGAGRKQKHF